VSFVQDLIDAAAPGANIPVPPGEYTIDAVNEPIRMKSDINLNLSGVTLRAVPNNKTNSKIITSAGASNIAVLNGTIIGERDTHLWTADQFPDGKLPADPKDYWKSGGWGHGIVIEGGSRNVSLVRNNISHCFGDGVYVADAYSVLLSRNVLEYNRRQGMSVICVDGMTVDSNQFSNTGRGGWTPPGCGIDFEPDYAEQWIKNVTVTKNVFADNEGSSIAWGTNKGIFKNCRVMGDNQFDLKKRPIWLAAGNLGTPWWAFLLNRSLSWSPSYRWWGYPTSWYLP
jgi:hypothetical protein